VVVLHVGTLHHLVGDSGPSVMGAYIDALASGSYVVFSHFYDPEVPELTALAKRIEAVLTSGPLGAGAFRTRAEIEAMLPGLEFIQSNGEGDVGLVPCAEWWPDGPVLRNPSPASRCIAGLVGRKP
jgi:hypothetical protein